MKRLFLASVFLLLGCILAPCQSRLVPRMGSNLDNYRAKLDEVLIVHPNFAFAVIIMPSFYPESCLYYANESGELIYRRAKKSVWSYDARYRKPSVKESRLSISSELGKKLTDLIDAAVYSSSFLADNLGLDGTTYEFRLMNDLYAATCWSPFEESNCFKLVNLLERVCKAVSSNDQYMLVDLIPDVDELTDDFKALFPPELQEKPWWIW